MLGVDRLDYTKGIRHRMKAFGELLADGRLSVEDATLVQVASPSRERVEAYKQLRDEIELTVGRINGDYGTMSHTAISYHHHGYPREEMVALYLAADIMLVTALRDGMNLVAKEYVAAPLDNDGVLVLSEFAGAADELKSALLINPHDIDGLKNTIMRAIEMPKRERTTRMRALRRRVLENDVAKWSASFLQALDRRPARSPHGSTRPAPSRRTARPRPTTCPSSTRTRRPRVPPRTPGRTVMPEQTPHADESAAPGLDTALADLAAVDRLLVALDFDGTLAPFADDPGQVGALPGSWAAVLTLQRAKDTEVVLVSGRPLDSLARVSQAPDGMSLVGSHGVEWRVDGHDEAALTEDEQARVARIGAALDAVGERFPGVVIEHKPAGHGVHTRRVSAEVAAEADAAASAAAHEADADVLERGGKDILDSRRQLADRPTARAAGCGRGVLRRGRRHRRRRLPRARRR